MDATSLWAESTTTASACLAHPFLTGIANGSLDRAAFEHYVGQDAFFLDAFAKAYALGIARSPDAPTMRRFKTLLDGAMDEQALHGAYAERWGVDLHPRPTAATRAYTDFLLATAALEPLHLLAAAMTPCMRLYAWLGQQMREDTDPDSAYREWVETYSSDDFEQLATAMDDLLDDLVTLEAPVDEGRLRQTYTTAMELEWAFFDSAHRSGAALPG
ncbi:TenA family protein [Euzebya tangerina]|uniref:TenA family protein n=1 Tax=Euzebya tangerina TaxID=591198 RepID=UPI000E32191E|nr:TenA family protein [Euzebya tangerina]